jgi:hypothetical protein
MVKASTPTRMGQFSKVAITKGRKSDLENALFQMEKSSKDTTKKVSDMAKLHIDMRMAGSMKGLI